MDKALILLMLLSGCAANAPIDKAIGRSEFTVRVDVQEAQFVDDVCRSVVAATVADQDTTFLKAGTSANGCSVWNRDERRLDMYVVEPESVNDAKWFSVIGHELWHGVRGKFHD